MNIKLGNFKRGVSIIGVGVTPFKSVIDSPEMKGMTERELFSWAAIEAMEDAHVEPKDIDAFYCGATWAANMSNQSHMAPVLADWIGMKNKPGIAIDAACVTTHAALRQAAITVASGLHDVVLAGGVEILSSRANYTAQIKKLPYTPSERTAVHGEELWDMVSAGVIDNAYGYPHAMAPGVLTYAPLVLEYAKRYGLSIDQVENVMMAICETIHRHGSLNPKAYDNRTLKEIAAAHGFDDVRKFWRSDSNPIIDWPCRRASYMSRADGASAIIVCAADVAKKYHDVPVDIIGTGQTVGTAISEDYTYYPLEVSAIEQAYEMAKIDPKKIGCISVHDCFQTAHITTSEALGYFKKGESWKAILEGSTAFDGDKPMNTTGGRGAMGHAFAASAGAEIAELVNQMRGEVDRRQVSPEPELAVCHNQGSGFTIAVTVFKMR